MTNWIEYYEDEDDALPSKLALVDIGGQGVGRTNAVDYIIKRLVAKAVKKTVQIDLCVISHQDSDHWNLIPHLLQQVKEKNLTLTVGEVWKSGQLWADRATAAVQRLADLIPKPADRQVYRFPNDDCDYTNRKGLRHIMQFGAVYIRTVAANVPLSSTDPGFIKNGSSAVVSVDLAGNSIILPGDATWETMSFINNKLYPAKKPPTRPGVVFALSVPHHGALRTAVEGYAADRTLDLMDDKIVKQFAKNLSTETIVASAGYLNSHKHPMLEIVKTFSAKVSSNNKEKHNYAAYNFGTGAWQQDTDIIKRIFTTATTISGGPQYYNGHYSMTSDGKTTFVLEEIHPRAAPRAPARVYAPPPTAEEWAGRDSIAPPHDSPTDDPAGR
jgi:beta-lactamase superfamily II metal-dependent hydrolase